MPQHCIHDVPVRILDIRERRDYQEPKSLNYDVRSCIPHRIRLEVKNYILIRLTTITGSRANAE